MFRRRLSSITVVMTLNASVADKPVVGSSRIKIEGLDTSSMPMHNRLRSPPLMDVPDLYRTNHDRAQMCSSVGLRVRRVE